MTRSKSFMLLELGLLTYQQHTETINTYGVVHKLHHAEGGGGV